MKRNVEKFLVKRADAALPIEPGLFEAYRGWPVGVLVERLSPVLQAQPGHQGDVPILDAGVEDEEIGFQAIGAWCWALGMSVSSR